MRLGRGTDRQYRVLLVAAQLRPGGIGSYILNLAAELDARGHQIVIFLTESPGAWFNLALAGRYEIRLVEGIEKRSGRAHVHLVAQEMRDLAPDVVILNHARHAQLALGLLPSATHVLPFVHGDNEWVYRLALTNLAECTMVLAPSPVVAAGIVRRAPQVPLELIAHGVPLPPAPQDPDPRDDAARFELLYVGRLDEGKGVELLPAIARGLAGAGLDCRLRVAGDGPMRAQLAAEAAVPCFSLLGSCEPQVVTRLFQEAHALLLPTESEGLPLVLLEAQAAGCIPLATRLAGSTRRAVRDGETGLLMPTREPRAYIDAVIRLARNRARWADLSRAARAWASEEYSQAAMGNRYEALFAKLGRGPLRRAGSGRLDPRLLAPRDFLPPALRRAFVRLRDG